MKKIGPDLLNLRWTLFIWLPAILVVSMFACLPAAVPFPFAVPRSTYEKKNKDINEERNTVQASSKSVEWLRTASLLAPRSGSVEETGAGQAPGEPGWVGSSTSVWSPLSDLACEYSWYFVGGPSPGLWPS